MSHLVVELFSIRDLAADCPFLNIIKTPSIKLDAYVLYIFNF
nr:MAG TPA: hypothetical protein [Caudoviricetes sp.]